MIILDYRDTRPLYEQIVDKFQMLILSGALEPNSRMPSVRSLAVELSINPNTIQRAYSELERTGFLYTVKGKGQLRRLQRQSKGRPEAGNFGKAPGSEKGSTGHGDDGKGAD